jgi:hypothetical protein
MDGGKFRFVSLADAVAALHATSEPMALTRFESVVAERVVIAVNAATAADRASPVPGEHPDARRDRDVTADVELDYLYRQLVERGHARQVVSIGGRLRELTVNRVYIEGDDAVYGFVSPRSREP